MVEAEEKRAISHKIRYHRNIYMHRYMSTSHIHNDACVPSRGRDEAQPMRWCGSLAQANATPPGRVFVGVGDDLKSQKSRAQMRTVSASVHSCSQPPGHVSTTPVYGRDAQLGAPSFSPRHVTPPSCVCGPDASRVWSQSKRSQSSESDVCTDSCLYDEPTRE